MSAGRILPDVSYFRLGILSFGGPRLLYNRMHIKDVITCFTRAHMKRQFRIIKFMLEEGRGREGGVEGEGRG